MALITKGHAFGMAALLVLSSLSGRADDARTVDDIKTWLSGYEPAFNAKDLERLASFYHPDVTIYEGGGINRGWADYRDHHLGPELQEMQQPRLARSEVAVQVVDPAGRSAYVTSEYRLQARIKEQEIDVGGLETLVVIRGADGPWKIRHSHTSSRRRSASSPNPSPRP
jgi:ketosteroid isomerase-like protein